MPQLRTALTGLTLTGVAALGLPALLAAPATAAPATTATASPTTTASPTATASPTPTATATPSATATATATPTATTSPTPRPRCSTVSVSSALVDAGRDVVVRATGQPGFAASLRAYSKPSSAYKTVRTGTFDSAGRLAWTLAPTTNTRMFVTSACGTDSASVVVSVRNVLTLTTRGSGQRVVFSGAVRPARNGVLVAVYRLGANGSRSAVGSVRTARDGRYSLTKTFTGTGQHSFRAEARTDGVNVGGSSPTRAVTLTAPAPKPAAKPTARPAAAAPAPKPAPRPEPAPQSSAYYANCSEARAAGAAPLYRGEPGYRAGLDRDRDGVACE